MKLIRWLLLVVVVSSSTVVSAEPDQWYEPIKITYKPSGLPEQKSEAEACKASAADLSAHGNKQTYVSFKPGSSPFDVTCMLKDSSGKTWAQENNVRKKLYCNDGTEAISWDKSGTFESQKCPCDPAKGCPKKQLAPMPRLVLGCPAKNGDHPVCKDRKARRRSAEELKRCTQQPAHAVDAKEVDRQSRANRASLTSDRDSREATAKYNRALAEIRKDEREKREIRTGRDQRGTEFPKFTRADMCETGGPTDVNIGSLCGTREEDFAAANNMVGLGSTPATKDTPGLDCVWHHHEELGRMQLVKRSAHATQPHTGGVKVWKDAFGVDYPLCCP